MRKSRIKIGVFNQDKILGKNNTLSLLLLGAFLIRIVFFLVYIAMGGNGVVGDTKSYVDSAINFCQSFSFGSSAFRTPGYPFFLSICMFFLNNNFYYAVVFLQILLNVIAIYYLYKLSILVFKDEKVAYIAVAIVALNPLDILYCYKILTDGISQSFLVISVCFFTQYIDSLKNNKNDFKHLMLSSIFLAINVLIRPSLMVLPFALSAGAAFIALICRRYKQIVTSVVCISLVSGLCIGAWTARNERVANYSGYSTVSDINMYQYNATVVYAKQNGMTYYEAFNVFRNNGDEELKPYLENMPIYEAYRKRGMELIMSDLPYYIFCCIKNCAYIAFYPGMMSFDFVKSSLNQVIAAAKSETGVVSSVMDNLTIPAVFAILILLLDVLLLLLLFLFSIVGLIKNIKSDWILTMVIVGVIAYGVTVSCQPVGIGAYSRFRLSISMFTSLFAAQGIRVLCAHIKNCINKKGEAN